MTLELEDNEILLIQEALMEMPMKKVWCLYNKIVLQKNEKTKEEVEGSKKE